VLSVERGFHTEGRLFATVSIPAAYPQARRTQIATDILSSLQKRPEVQSASVVSGRPLAGGNTGMGIAAADIPLADANVPWASWRLITTDYFKTLGLSLVDGRNFTEQDIVGKPYRVIISKRLATLLWKGQNPVGRTAILWKGQNQREGEVIGVVNDMRERGLESDPTLAVYLPAYGALGGTTVLFAIHVHGAPEQFAPALRSVVNEVDRMLPVSDIRTMEETVNASVATRRFTMRLLLTFAALALLLALAGVYGIVEYSLARRTAEIGLRLAVGARPGAVLSLMMTQGLRPVATGIVVGLVGMFWLSRLMQNLLFGVQARDFITYSTVVALLGLIALIACYVPARRALRIDPATALRVD
jgi:predicted permease